MELELFLEFVSEVLGLVPIISFGAPLIAFLVDTLKRFGLKDGFAPLASGLLNAILYTVVWLAGDDNLAGVQTIVEALAAHWSRDSECGLEFVGDGGRSRSTHQYRDWVQSLKEQTGLIPRLICQTKEAQSIDRIGLLNACTDSETTPSPDCTSSSPRPSSDLARMRLYRFRGNTTIVRLRSQRCRILPVE